MRYFVGSTARIAALVPAKEIGRPLSRVDANKLLDRLGRWAAMR
jgi:hypothetical protein